MKTEMKVFVYGTLMAGRSNHNLLAGRKYIGAARLDGYAMYYLGSFPGIVPAIGESVLGEVYEIDSRTLSRLDRLEMEGTLYKRVSDDIYTNGEKIRTYVYVWLRSVEGCRKVKFNEMPWEPARAG